MKHDRKLLVIVLAVLLLAGSLSGCGSTIKQSTSEENTLATSALEEKDIVQEQASGSRDNNSLEKDDVQMNYSETKSIWLPVTEITIKSGGTEQYREFHYTYNEEGLLESASAILAAQSAIKSDGVDYQYDYEWDNNNEINVTYEYAYSEEEMRTGTQKFYLDNHGNIIKYQSSTGGITTYENEYDEEGKLLGHIVTGNDSDARYVKYNYNERVLEEINTYRGEKNEYTYSFEYQYDEHGLITQRKVYRDSELFLDSTYAYAELTVPQEYDESVNYAISIMDLMNR